MRRARLKQKPAAQKILYEGQHSIPVINYRVHDFPLLLQFNFTVYRESVKIVVEAKMS